MSPGLNYIFQAKSHGRTVEVTQVGPTNADTTFLAKQLELAGYTYVRLLRKEWETWAWPGGYPIYHLCADSGVLCPKCANDNIEMTSDPDANPDWRVTHASINYEDKDLYCDHCSKPIESAYGNDQQQLDSKEEP